MEQPGGEHPGLVALRDIPFSCLSAETLLPIYGKCHVAYKIENKILGLSKIPRLANAISRRIQTQQQFTDALMEAIAQKTESSKVFVSATATHIYYDRPLTAVSTFAAHRDLQHGSSDLQDLEALLPPVLPVSRGRDSEPATGESISSSDLVTLNKIHASLLTLLSFTRIELRHQDSLRECARQLFHATIGLRERGTLDIGAVSILCDSETENNAERNPRFATCVVDFVSMCEHHLLPFHGRVFVGCEPRDSSVSDLAVVIRNFIASRSRRPQVQERLTNQIADFVSAEFSSMSVAVLCEAYHLCMIARGPETKQTSTRTCCRRGVVPPELLRIGDASLERKRE